jgi:hypothetical protein
LPLEQRTLADYADIPYAAIFEVDGETRSPPIRLSVAELDNLVSRASGDWDRIKIMLLDWKGEPKPGSEKEFVRGNKRSGDHFLL